MNRSRSAFALGVVATLLAASGCSGDDPQPKVAPTEPTSASTSPSPTGPVEPRDPVGTVRAWIEAQNEAMRTGDTARVRQLSADPCQACDDFIEPIEKVYADGGRFITDGWKLVGAKQRSSNTLPRVVDTAISIAGGRTILKSGGAPVRYETEKHIMVFKLKPAGSGWNVSFIGFLS